MISAADAMFYSTISSLRFLHRGKVRDIYEVDERNLLIVQTDRLSAFDVILPTPIPGKGKILTALSNFWFGKLQHIIPNHLTTIAPESVVSVEEQNQVTARAFVVRKLQPFPIEAVVRGYLAGSGWKEYQQSQNVCGVALPAGLREADRLPHAIFTPATKAPAGQHDENISYEKTAGIIGDEFAAQIRDAAIKCYEEAAAYALQRNIIIADTKFEFGLDDENNLFLIDEALTPDSSRFWPVDKYKIGKNPPSFDKQFVRDWLETLDWNKKAPGPNLPDDVLEQTAQKYQEALRLLVTS